MVFDSGGPARRVPTLPASRLRPSRLDDPRVPWSGGAVFVDGCFWHGCPKPKHAPMPKNRAEWWAAKLGRNKERDLLVNRTLRKLGWKVIRVWECDLKPKNWPRIAARVSKALDARR